ncbi:MAG: hypothetical protein KF866_06615 [Phycisphaeraceae bacterium]|nr:hypothetical protein [Phycisphaeraceae bacterium]
MGYIALMKARAWSLLAAVVVSASAVFAAPDVPANPEVRSSALAEAVEAVELTLAGMSSAVLAGDVAGYLEQIWRSDKVLAAEERHFIEDCVKNRPVQFHLSMSDAVFEGERLRGQVTASWRMEEGALREVSYPAWFVRDESAWRYAGRVWEERKAPGVLVKFVPGLEDIAEATLAELPAIMEMVHEDLGVMPPPGFVQEVKMYETMIELQYSIFPSYKDPLGGWNEPGESIKVLVRPSTRLQQLKTLLAHEYGHVGTFIMGEKATDAPWWVLEGVAEHVSSGISNSPVRVHRRVLGWARQDNLAPWEAMNDFPLAPEHRKWGGHVYTQGHHMVAFITTTFGRDARNRWLRAMAGGMSIDEASREALGAPFEEVDRRWREAIDLELLTEEVPADAPAEAAGGQAERT